MPEPWKITVDVHITRRKRYQMVTDPEGVVRWKSRDLWSAIEFMDAEGVTEYLIAPSDEELWHNARPVRANRE